MYCVLQLDSAAVQLHKIDRRVHPCLGHCLEASAPGRYLFTRNYGTPHVKISANSFAFVVTVQVTAYCREVPRKDDTTATFSLRLERAILKAAADYDFFKKGLGVGC